MISNRVESVSKTKILAASNVQTNRQLTVYSNVVENHTDGNAMILPVPYPNTAQFHDLTNYKNIFEDCAHCFLSAKTKSLTRSFSMNDKMKTLKVFRVGSYDVSLAHSLEDLKRVDTIVFKLSEGCAELLTAEYNNPVFGFIICKLAKGKEEYHPFGYSHKLLNTKYVFLPTKHYHDHEGVDDIDKAPMFHNALQQATVQHNLEIEEWDHEIYLYNATANKNNDFKNMSKTSKWSGDNYIQKDKLDFELSPLTHFEKHRIYGIQKNIDLICTVSA